MKVDSDVSPTTRQLVEEFIFHRGLGDAVCPFSFMEEIATECKKLPEEYKHTAKIGFHKWELYLYYLRPETDEELQERLERDKPTKEKALAKLTLAERKLLGF